MNTAQGIDMAKLREQKEEVPPPYLDQPELQVATESQPATENPRPEKPLDTENPRPKDFTGVVSAPPQGQNGVGIGKGTKYRAKVFGYPVTGVIRWMWKNNFNFYEIKSCLADLLEIPPQDTTLKLQRAQLKNGTKPVVPDLTPEQSKVLEGYKTT